MNILYDTRSDASKRNLWDRLKGLPVGRYSIEIEKYEKKRSLDANAYWWAAVVTPLAEHCGYSPAEMHTVLCSSYFGVKTIEIGGKTYEVPRRTTTSPNVLGTMEFSDLIQQGHNVAAGLGVAVEPRQEWESAA